MGLFKTFSEYVMIRLDPENDHIKTKSGFTLYIDTSFEKEKHQVVTGTVIGLPSRLLYTGKPNIGMPWLTDMELREGDKVICHYLAVINALKPEQQRYIHRRGEKDIFILYSSIFVAIRNGEVIPINGYCLIEPTTDPWAGETKERLKKIGIELVSLNAKSNTNVTFGIVRHTGKPNREYVDDGNSDEGVDVKIGDTVVLRKISDIPLQYPLHTTIDGGKEFYRVQRRKILAVV